MKTFLGILGLIAYLLLYALGIIAWSYFPDWR
jgi:hypothetical protein